MAKYTGPVCRQCRREGSKLFLKGDRCYSKKNCPLMKEDRRGQPGIHGQSRKKPTPYSAQLREKQKTKRIYGLTEKQFRGYYLTAEKMRGATGENMLILLERRLDNVVYRLGFGASRAQARQIVNHGYITVNGRRVDIPSYLVKPGDAVEVKDSKKDKALFADLKKCGDEPKRGATNIVKWLELVPSRLKGTVVEMPTRDDIDMQIAEHMIVELYSK